MKNIKLIVLEGAYQIVEESAEIDGTKYQNRIIFDDSNRKVFIKVSANRLLICQGTIASDGSTSTYERM